MLPVTTSSKIGGLVKKIDEENEDEVPDNEFNI